LTAPRIADRKNEFAFFGAMLTGKCLERIFLIRAPSESGKTILLAEFAKHAETVLGNERCARINLKGEPPLRTVLDRICVDLGRDTFPKFCSGGIPAPVQIHAELPQATFGDENRFTMESHIHQATAPSSLSLASNLIADLLGRKTPSVLIIDTFEQATAETSKWIVQELLPMVRTVPQLWVVVGGQDVPEANDYRLEWGDLAKSHRLLPVTSPEDWHEYACQQFPDFPRQDIEVICRGLTSHPAAIEEFIRVSGSRLGGPKTGTLS
jgi:hypothetical protein